MELKFFPDQSKALGGEIAPIPSIVVQTEAPKALRELHRSLPQENTATVSDNLDNPDFFMIEVLWSRPMKMDIRFVFCRLKCTSLNKKIRINYFILDVFNSLFAALIAQHSELSILKFWDSGNFPE